MKKHLFRIVLFLSPLSCFSQAYIPMPSDSAVWRYRIYDMDYITQILDNSLFINGKDTVANGYTYHKLFSRTCKQTGAPGFNPPFVTTDASAPDIVYGAVREESKKVYTLAGTGEQLIFDFNAVVGDMIPAYSGTIKVTGIDSILISGIYHKRYLTTDAGYSVIEGVGSSRGLLPGINDGGSDMLFICFTHATSTYSPDSTIPCTYIYPYGYQSAVTNVNDPSEINVFPVPANDLLHVSTNTRNGVLNMVIVSSVGQIMWQGDVKDEPEIPVGNWPRGVYYVTIYPGKFSAPLIKKLILD